MFSFSVLLYLKTGFTLYSAEKWIQHRSFENEKTKANILWSVTRDVGASEDVFEGFGTPTNCCKGTYVQFSNKMLKKKG